MTKGSIKIAIVGGGLFGCNVAGNISKNKKVSTVHIYESQDKLFSGASSNNQHRFHTGYHYPRSKETINQIRHTSESFIRNFSDCIFNIKNNYYFVSSEGKITFNDYKTAFVDESVELNNLDNFKQYLHTEKISGGLISNEKGINLYKLKNKLLNNLKNDKINIFTNNTWNSNLSKKYDLIINCSYFNPSLTTDKIKVKYEACVLLLIKNPFNLKNYSMTIMDGPFSSLYATENEDIYTLSNVEKTPFYKTDSLEELLKFYNKLQNFNFDAIDKDILLKTSEYYKFNNIEIVGRYLTKKVKILNDVNDLRKTEIIFENKYVTMLQGKISTMQFAAEEILKYIENM